MKDVRFVGTGDDPYTIQILREFSLFDFIGVLYHTGGPNAWKPVHEKMEPETLFSCGGLMFRVLWTRLESNEQGNYMAVGLTIKISAEQMTAWALKVKP